MNEGNVKIEIEENKYSKIARITPLGFWTNVITVTQDTKLGTTEKEGSEIKWSCGGTDGTLSMIETTQNFIAGLQEAIKIAEKWDKEA